MMTSGFLYTMNGSSTTSIWDVISQQHILTIMLRYLERREPCSILMLSFTQSQFPSMVKNALRPVTKDDIWKKFRNNGGMTYMCDNDELNLIEWSIQNMPRWKDELYPHFEPFLGKITNNQWKAIEWMMKHQPRWITQPRQLWNVSTGMKKMEARNNISLLEDCCNDRNITFVLDLVRTFDSAGIDVSIFGKEMTPLRHGMGKYGRLDILKHYKPEMYTALSLYGKQQYASCYSNDIAFEAARSGMVHVLDWLLLKWKDDNRIFDFKHIWYYMIEDNNLQTLNWFIESGIHPREYIRHYNLVRMLNTDNVLLFDRVTTHFRDFFGQHFDATESEFMDLAVACRCKKILSFLYQQRRIPLPQNFDELCARGDVSNKTIEWAYEAGMGYMFSTGARAAFEGDINHLRWLLMNDFEMDVEWISEAIRNNHTHIVKWLFECNIIHPKTLELCITFNRMKMVKWYANRAPKNNLISALSHIENLMKKPFHESNMKPSRKSQLFESRKIITMVLHLHFHGEPRPKKLRK